MTGRFRWQPERRNLDGAAKALLTALFLAMPLTATAQTAAERALDNLRSPSSNPAYSNPVPSAAERALDRLRQQQRERLGPGYESSYLDPAPAGVPDQWLSLQAQSAIRRDLAGSRPDIGVHANQGVVTLTGVVGSELELHRLRERVQSLPGVERVETSGIRVMAP